MAEDVRQTRVIGDRIDRKELKENMGATEPAMPFSRMSIASLYYIAQGFPPVWGLARTVHTVIASEAKQSRNR